MLTLCVKLEGHERISLSLRFQTFKFCYISTVVADKKENQVVHQLIETPPLSEDDVAEIAYLQNLARRLNSVGSFSNNSTHIKVDTFFVSTIKKAIRRFSRTLKRGSRARNKAGLVVSLLPTQLRNFVIQTIIETNISASMTAQPKLYSLDLGFGIPTSNSPRVTLIIPVHNQWFTTLKCLQAIQKNTDSTPYEVILVDDASTDKTFEAAQNIRGIQIVKILENVGYLRATNLGATYAKTEYLVLLNNDTEPVSGWLDELVAEMDSDASVAICGSTLLYPAGILQESGCQIFRAGNAWNLGRGQNPINGMFQFHREVDYVSAASMIVRNSFWKELGGFDKQFAPAYCEDSDLCLAAWDKGYKVLVTPNSWVIHHEGVSHGTSISSGIKANQVRNQKKLQTKWRDTLPNHWLDIGVPRIEYSRDSKGIVFVADRQYPAITRDAGSVRTLQIIKHLVALNFHVVFTSLDPSTTELDLVNLRKMGVEAHVSWKDALSALELRGERVVHAWLIRSEVFDFFANHLRDFIPECKISADLIDLDYGFSNGSIVINKYQLQVSNSADQVILVSEIEASYLRKSVNSKRVNVVWAEYPPRKTDRSFENSLGLIFVGGFRHTPNVEGITWFAESVVPYLNKAGFSAPIRIVGTGLSEREKSFLAEKGLQIMGRQSDLSPVYEQSRVAIVPLISGRGLKGKLGEALSYKLPVVTTPVGAEGFGFSSGDSILIASDPREFAAHILQAHENRSKWESMSNFGSRYCLENLSSEAMRKKVQSVLEINQYE